MLGGLTLLVSRAHDKKRKGGATMAKKKIDWLAIREEYISGRGSTTELAARYGVPLKTVKYHCTADGWVRLKEQVAQKASDDAVARAAGSVSGYRDRICAAAMRLLDRVEEYLGAADQAGRVMRSADILNVARALRDIKDVADVKAPGDLEEQAARIDKLRADAKRDDDGGEEIRVELTPEAEEYAG